MTRAAVLALALAACASTSSTRLSPENHTSAPGTRPIAVVQANVTTFNLLFVKIPGDVSLDRVVNQMLVVEAKNLGADQVVLLDAHVDPESGIWFLWRLLGWQSAEAVGVAVTLDGPGPDPGRMDGPEVMPATPNP